MTTPLKALIVDDERLARNAIRNKLAAFPRLNVVAEADDVASAREALRRHTPDVIFLDIQMPGCSGFDLLEHIPAATRIIFVTAYDQYAIRAFDVNALDYLLKPIDPGRLARAIARLESDTGAQPRRTIQPEYHDSVLIVLDNHFRFVKIDTIVSIGACGNYSEVVTTDGKKSLTLKSLKAWERLLPQKNFCRIHKSTILNIGFIERIEEWINYSHRVHVKGSKEPLLLSRRYAARLRKQFG